MFYALTTSDINVTNRLRCHTTGFCQPYGWCDGEREGCRIEYPIFLYIEDTLIYFSLSSPPPKQYHSPLLNHHLSNLKTTLQLLKELPKNTEIPSNLKNK